MSDEPLAIWTVYDHPMDYPDHYVARRFDVRADGAIPTDSIIVKETLEALRRVLESRGLFPIARSSGDDARIIETWV